MPAWANNITIYWWSLLINELYSFNMWRISKVQDWIYHQLLGNGKKSEAVGVKVNFKENLKQLLFRHLKNNKFKVKIAGRVKPEKLKQHFNATSCNIVKSIWEMLCGSWPKRTQHLATYKILTIFELDPTCCNMLLRGGQSCATRYVQQCCKILRLTRALCTCHSGSKIFYGSISSYYMLKAWFARFVVTLGSMTTADPNILKPFVIVSRE